MMLKTLVWPSFHNKLWLFGCFCFEVGFWFGRSFVFFPSLVPVLLLQVGNDLCFVMSCPYLQVCFAFSLVT